MFMPADDESELRVLHLEARELDVLPHVQVRNTNDEIDVASLEHLHGLFGNSRIVGIVLQVVSLIAPIDRVQCQREHTDGFVARFKHELGFEGAIDIRCPRFENVVVSEPVELRRSHRGHQLIRTAPIEFMVSGDHEHRRDRVHEIEGVDDLQSVPELALE
jgi:hypothetical protein